MQNNNSNNTEIGNTTIPNADRILNPVSVATLKNTEIGNIPMEWEVKTLGELAEVMTGSTPSTHDRSFYGDDYFFVSPADLGKNKYILNTEKKLSLKGFEISRKFPKNSILYTCIGSTIGKSGIAKRDLTSNQ